MRKLSILLILFNITQLLTSQNCDVLSIYTGSNGVQSTSVFKNAGTSFSLNNAEITNIQSTENATINSKLTVSGDFNADGITEAAVFCDYTFFPNTSPKFIYSKIVLYGQRNNFTISIGTWFSKLKSDFNFDAITFSSAGDFNADGKTDIVLVWNDEEDDNQKIFVLYSNGTSFNEPKLMYTVSRKEFNFSAVKFIVAGNFIGDSKSDLAVFYNYFGETPQTNQKIFVLEAQTNYFLLSEPVFSTTKATYDFDYCKAALPGDFNGDGKDDIACVQNDIVNDKQTIDVFENVKNTGLTFKNYLTPLREEFNFSNVRFFKSGKITNDTKTDLLFFYDHTGFGTQIFFVFQSDGIRFLNHQNYYSTPKTTFSLDNANALLVGNFDIQPKISPAIWYNNKKGAVTFGFDDGLTNALRYGANELSKNKLRGTFYVISNVPFNNEVDYCNWDTLRYYKNRGHELGSHTANHRFMGNYTGVDSLALLNSLLLKSKNDLNTELNQNTISLSYPFGNYNKQTPNEVSKYFLNARSSQEGFNPPTPFDFYNIKSQYLSSTTPNATIKSWFTTAETYNYHLSLMYHNIQNQAFDKLSDEYSFALTDFKQNIADAMQANLWIDTQANVYKYTKERNALKTISYDIYSDSISFVADDFLDNTLYNQELTMRVEIPQTWAVDSVYSNRSTKKLAVFSANGRKFCFVNSVPDNSVIRISKTKIVSSISTTYQNNKLFNSYRKDKNTIVIIPQNPSFELYKVKFMSMLGSVLYEKELYLSSEIKLDIPDRIQWGILLITDTQNQIISSNRIR